MGVSQIEDMDLATSAADQPGLVDGEGVRCGSAFATGFATQIEGTPR
jgi:hypothetical protein